MKKYALTLTSKDAQSQIEERLNQPLAELTVDNVKQTAAAIGREVDTLKTLEGQDTLAGSLAITDTDTGASLLLEFEGVTVADVQAVVAIIQAATQPEPAADTHDAGVNTEGATVAEPIQPEAPVEEMPEDQPVLNPEEPAAPAEPETQTEPVDTSTEAPAEPAAEETAAPADQAEPV